jgi:hypothetical protein
MSLARVENVSKVRGAGENPFGRGWLVSLTALFLLTVAVGLAVGRMLSSRAAIAALAGIRLLFVGVIHFVAWLVSPVWRLIEPLLNRLFDALKRLFEQEPQPLSPADEGLFPLGQFQGPLPFVDELSTMISRLEPIWPILRTALIASLLLLLVVYAIRRSASIRGLAGAGSLLADEGEDLRRSVPDLGSVPRRIVSWFAGLPARGRALASRGLRTAIVARRVYARLLKIAAENGRPRRRWETPLEFQVALNELFPTRKSEIELITATYLHVRYGERLESEATAEEVQAAWSRIRSGWEG